MKWAGGIVIGALGAMLLQFFTGVFGHWLTLPALEDRLSPGPDIVVSADTVYLDDEGRSLVIPGYYVPSPQMQYLMAQPGAAGSPRVLAALRRAGGINLGWLSIRIVVQGQRKQQIRILDIKPVALHRASPLAGTLIDLPAQGGPPTMKMIYDFDELDPIAHEVVKDQNSTTPGKAFFGDQTITLRDGEQEVLLVRAETSLFDVTFNLKIDYLLGTTRKTTVVTNHGQPFHVTAAHCRSTGSQLAYRRTFELQGNFSIRPLPGPLPPEQGLSCTAVSTSTAPTKTPTPTGTPQCGQIKTLDSTGSPLPAAMRDEVTAVHDAACRRDYQALQHNMDYLFSGMPRNEAINQLRRAGDTALTVLTQTLESSARLDQGGLFYCHPHGAVTVFPRGTLAVPGKWNFFSLIANPDDTALVKSFCQ